MSENALSLYELTGEIRRTLEEKHLAPVWIMAEISELNEKQHCYLELVQKDEDSNNVIARCRATIWSYTYNMLKAYFETSTGYRLEAGLKVLLQVRVQFHELYGLSLDVRDIDPNYTLGDIERRKKEVLRLLEAEGIIDMNKALEIPDLPKRIAIISSEKAAGYQDFIQQLQDNDADYKFTTQLFSATMQGDAASQSIRKALEKIYVHEGIFDVVIIIRGGGATADLACFDDYELASHIAQFPLPVITGIGHDKDISIADKVANTSLKTPTAVADFFVRCFDNCAEEINHLTGWLKELTDRVITKEEKRILDCARIIKYNLPSHLNQQRMMLASYANKLDFLSENILKKQTDELVYKIQFVNYLMKNKTQEQEQHLKNLQKKAQAHTQRFIERKIAQLSQADRELSLLSPQKLLERGYSITMLEGKVVKNADTLTEGALLETRLAKGCVRSKVDK